MNDNTNIIIRACPICGSKVKITTKASKYGSYDPCVEIFIECSNEDCGYLGDVKSFDDVERAIELWNNVVHKFEQVRVGSQLRGRKEAEK